MYSIRPMAKQYELDRDFYRFIKIAGIGMTGTVLVLLLVWAYSGW